MRRIPAVAVLIAAALAAGIWVARREPPRATVAATPADPARGRGPSAPAMATGTTAAVAREAGEAGRVETAPRPAELVRRFHDAEDPAERAAALAAFRAADPDNALGPYLAASEAARRGESVTIPTAPPAYDWIYARDLVGGLLALLDARDPPHREVNLASGLDWAPHYPACLDALSRAFPAFRWRHAAPGETPTIRWNESRNRGVMANARARDFGWRPRHEPAAAVADYAAWLLASANQGLP